MRDHADRAEKDRQSDPNREGVGGAAAAGNSGEQIALERGCRHSGAAEGIETDASRFPGFTGGPDPEHGGLPAQGLQVQLHRLTPIHEALAGSDSDRRDCRLPGSAWMPERRGDAFDRSGGSERRSPGCQTYEARQ